MLFGKYTSILLRLLFLGTHVADTCDLEEIMRDAAIYSVDVVACRVSRLAAWILGVTRPGSIAPDRLSYRCTVFVTSDERT